MQTSHQKIASSFGTDIDTVCSSLSTPITTNHLKGRKKKRVQSFQGKVLTVMLKANSWELRQLLQRQIKKQRLR